MIFKQTILIIGLGLVLGFSSLSVAQRGGIGGVGTAGQIGARGLNQPESPSTTVSVQPPPVTDLDTVLLTVSVTGSQNNSVAGIPRERFQVLEDGEEQKISYFWEDSRPMTVGFIFDDSARMDSNDKINVLKEAAQAFLKGKNPRDEYFLVRMASLADVAVSFTTEVKNLPSTYGASGELALYDGVYVGLAVIKEAANPRKLLVVITAGGDRCEAVCSADTLNRKRTTEDMLREIARKGNAQVYPVLVIDDITDVDSEFVHRDDIVLNDVAVLTGGRMYNATNAARAVEALMAEIARGLKTQYIVGFKSTREARDGKRRGVKVKVNSPEGSPKFNVWTKSAYWAREE